MDFPNIAYSAMSTLQGAKIPTVLHIYSAHQQDYWLMLGKSFTLQKERFPNAARKTLDAGPLLMSTKAVLLNSVKPVL